MSRKSWFISTTLLFLNQDHTKLWSRRTFVDHSFQITLSYCHLAVETTPFYNCIFFVITTIITIIETSTCRIEKNLQEMEHHTVAVLQQKSLPFCLYIERRMFWKNYQHFCLLLFQYLARELDKNVDNKNIGWFVNFIRI